MLATVLQCDYCRNLLVNIHNEPRADVDRISQVCQDGPSHDFCHKFCYDKWHEFNSIHHACKCVKFKEEVISER